MTISTPPPVREAPRATPQKQDVAGLPPRAGASRPGRLVKAILRVPLKWCYYALRFCQRYRLFVGLALLLLITSVVATVRLTTREWPLGIGNDAFHIQTQPRDGRDASAKIKGWLYALRKGDATALQLSSATLPSPTDTSTLSQYIESLSATDTRQWGEIMVLSVQPREDTSLDYFLSVEIITNGPEGKHKALAYFYFVTAPGQGGERLLRADYLFMRPLG